MVKWGARNKNYYEGLGYRYTKFGDEFEVDVKHLSNGSHAKVECVCDNCGKKLNWHYCDYLIQVKKDEKTYCNKCSLELFINDAILKL